MIKKEDRARLLMGKIEPIARPIPILHRKRSTPAHRFCRRYQLRVVEELVDNLRDVLDHSALMVQFTMGEAGMDQSHEQRNSHNTSKSVLLPTSHDQRWQLLVIAYHDEELKVLETKTQYR